MTTSTHFPRQIPWLLALMLSLSPALAHDRVRTPVRIPDILGYQTLKCDFHTHTVFSDGHVWPDVRSEEAWREGLDAIAITDHIEYQPHKEDLPTNHNRSHQIAKPHGDALNVIVIRGSEITRQMPPGHINAVFLKNVEPVDTPDWRNAVAEAHEQGAFIFWNHPGWRGQQPDGRARWYEEHSELVEEGMLHGIEVVNSREYYPEAHAWCLEKNLTMLSNSDIHAPLNLDYDVHAGDHRPMTLVFAHSRTPEAIHEALREQRTVVYSGNLLIGREKFLRPLFAESIRILDPSLRLRGKQRVYVQIENRSDLDFELELQGEYPDLQLPKELNLPGGKISLLQIQGSNDSTAVEGKLSLRFRVKNLLVRPGESLPIDLVLRAAAPSP